MSITVFIKHYEIWFTKPIKTPGSSKQYDVLVGNEDFVLTIEAESRGF